jgi:hypothetical protein
LPIRELVGVSGVVYDVKGVLDKDYVDLRM